MAEQRTLDAERADFEAFAISQGWNTGRNKAGEYYSSSMDRSWSVWQAARRAPPALDAEGLPELPKPVRMSADQAYLGYTAEQVRQAMRDAVAADRRRQQKEIGYWSERTRASVDTEEFREVADAWAAKLHGKVAGDHSPAWAALIAHINAWGSAGSGVPADPMDWPIPCDIKTGACTIRKGCSLRTVVARMESLHRMATAALPKLSPEEREANWKALQDAAAPSPAPQGEQA